MNWKVDNHNVKISENDFRVSQSELSFDGNIDNLILYILDEKDKIDINGKLASEKMIFEELFTITEINDDEEEDGVFISVLPTWLDVNISVNVKEFWYNNFTSSDFTTDVNYNSKNLKLTVNEMNMKTLVGSISGDINYFENKVFNYASHINLISKGFKSYFINGAIFIMHRELIIKKKIYDNKRHGLFLMPKYRSIDINDINEIKITESLLIKK